MSAVHYRRFPLRRRSRPARRSAEADLALSLPSFPCSSPAAAPLLRRFVHRWVRLLPPGLPRFRALPPRHWQAYPRPTPSSRLPTVPVRFLMHPPPFGPRCRRVHSPSAAPVIAGKMVVIPILD